MSEARWRRRLTTLGLVITVTLLLFLLLHHFQVDDERDLIDQESSAIGVDSGTEEIPQPARATRPLVEPEVASPRPDEIVDHRVFVRALDQEGRVIPGARAWEPASGGIRQIEREKTRTAGEDGHVAIPARAVEQTSLDVFVWAEGFKSRLLRNLPLGSRHDVVLEPGERLLVRFLDRRGRVLEGIPVSASMVPYRDPGTGLGRDDYETLLPNGHPLSAKSFATSNAEGIATLTGLETGKYLIQVGICDFMREDGSIGQAVTLPSGMIDVRMKDVWAALVPLDERMRETFRVHWRAADGFEHVPPMIGQPIAASLDLKYPNCKVFCQSMQSAWIDAHPEATEVRTEASMIDGEGYRRKFELILKPLRLITGPQEIVYLEPQGPSRHQEVVIEVLGPDQELIPDVPFRLERTGERAHGRSGHPFFIAPDRYRLGPTNALLKAVIPEQEILVKGEAEGVQRIRIEAKAPLSEVEIAGVAPWGPFAWTGGIRIEQEDLVYDAYFQSATRDSFRIVLPEGKAFLRIRTMSFLIHEEIFEVKGKQCRHEVRFVEE